MNKIEGYFDSRIKELRELANRGDPWIFLCTSSFIEYLARMTYGKETLATDYKNFLTNYFFIGCPEYGHFRYASGTQDLADQMYHVLRCGIAHSFSLIADAKAKIRSGRDRSILLDHRRSGKRHLRNYVNNHTRPKIDAAVFVAEDFVEDIDKVMQYIFSEARKRRPSGKQLNNNMKLWITKYPPIGASRLRE